MEKKVLADPYFPRVKSAPKCQNTSRIPLPTGQGDIYLNEMDESRVVFGNRVRGNQSRQSAMFKQYTSDEFNFPEDLPKILRELCTSTDPRAKYLVAYQDVLDYQGLNDMEKCFQMEYCNAKSLEQYLAEGKNFTEAEVQVCWSHLKAALDYLHEKGLVYRALSPDHVLLHVTPEGELLYKLGGLEHIGVQGVQKTKYEQNEVFKCYVDVLVIGRWNNYTVDSDLFALGALLYRMLTGSLITKRQMRELSSLNEEVLKAIIRARTIYIERLKPVSIGTTKEQVFKVPNLIWATTSEASPQDVVVKKLSHIETEMQALETLDLVRTLIQTPQSSRHPNIASYFDVWYDSSEKQISVVREYAQSTLSDFQPFKEGTLFANENEALDFLKEMVNALVYLHDNKIILRALSPDHILVNVDEETKEKHYKFAGLEYAIFKGSPNGERRPYRSSYNLAYHTYQYRYAMEYSKPFSPTDDFDSDIVALGNVVMEAIKKHPLDLYSTQRQTDYWHFTHYHYLDKILNKMLQSKCMFILPAQYLLIDVQQQRGFSRETAALVEDVDAGVEVIEKERSKHPSTSTESASGQSQLP